MTAPESELPTPSGDGVRIVYIAGAQHCGSTLLDAILCNAPGARSLGEVGGVHRYQSADSCDCRQPPGSCAPCGAAISALAESGALATFHQLSPLPLKERRAYWTVTGAGGRAEYARVADILFDAVARETRCRVLVDSSKNISRAAALIHDSRHDVRVVHLIRDGRGYLRSRRRRASGDRRSYPLPVAIAPWLAKNLLLSAVLRRATTPDRYLLCRYENLADDPARELARIGAFAGLDTTALAAEATAEGLVRRHLFEPRRRVDYRQVRLDRSRLRSQRESPRQSLWYWLSGGFVSGLWGYDRRQRYLDRLEDVTAP
ncbi:hypothetical protein BH18ACT4_BH18ACT4_00980 [soil metagenome]